MSNLQRLLSDELESFYWIGFMMADGWITSNVYHGHKHEKFGFQLSKLDGPHLELLASYINATVSYGSRNTNYKMGSEYSRLSVNDAINVPKIRSKFGLTHNSKTENPPIWNEYNFSDTQLISLFLGYIDGDGSVNLRKGGTKLHLSLQTKATWRENIEFMLAALQRITGIVIAATPSVNCRGHLHLSICKNQLVWWLKVFGVTNALPILKRKWDKVTAAHAVPKRNTSKIVTFVDADGKTHTFSSIRKFATTTGLNYNAVLRLTSKRIQQYHGWTLSEED